MKHEHQKSEDHASHNKQPFYKTFYKSDRFWSISLAILFLVFALSTSLYFRLSTVNLGVTDTWAENTIRQNAITQLSAGIRQTYPTLPDSSVQTEAAKQWADYVTKNKDQIDQQKAYLSAQFKSQFQFVTGKTTPYNQTYILEMDPYYWWNHAVNYADHGSVCEKGSLQNSDGTCTDLKRLAPQGTAERLTLHTFLEGTAIKVMRVVNDNVDSQTVAFFFPAILGTLAVIPAFFIARKFAGNIGGFVAGMIIATHPVLMNRTIAGFADTDGYVYLLPLLLIWAIIEAFQAKRWWSRLTLTATAGLFVGLFAFAWSGWWFMFFVTIVCIIAYILYRIILHFIHHQHPLKELIAPAAVAGMFFIASLIFVTLFVSSASFFSSFTAPFSQAANMQAPTSLGEFTGWPNILTTVAELNIPSLSAIISNFGGLLVVVFAAFGIFATLIDPQKIRWTQVGFALIAFIYYYVLIKNGLGLSPILFLFLFALPLLIAVLIIIIKNFDVNLRMSVFMMGWLLATFFASTLGIRFVLLGIAPFALGFGIGIGWLFIAITTALEHEIHKPFIIKGAVGVLLLFIIFNPAAAYSPLTIAKNAATQQAPGMNDGWWDAMTAIREQTPANTIITSWWDFGHWFRNIGNRSVTFDGGSQTPTQGHWVGKMLLSSNENQAIAILRMLDCGANKGYSSANKYLSVVESKSLIDTIIVLPEQEAKKRLQQTIIPSAEQEIILQNIHCVPPPAVFITSGDMIGKAGVWGHFGSWDFRKAMAYQYTQELPQTQAITKIQELNYTEAEATEMYYAIRALRTQAEGNSWIAGWPGYITQDMRSCTVDNKSVTCALFMGIQQTPQGVLAIETITFNTTKPQDATIQLGVYDSNNQRLGGSSSKPTRLVLADTATKKMQNWTNPSSDFTMGLLIQKQTVANSTSYSVLIADPSQIDSLFTQLYLLDGVFNKYFTKFIETREPGGSRIVVWNVTWPKD